MIEAQSNSFSGSIPVLIDLLAVIKEIELSESVSAGPIPTKVSLLMALEAVVLFIQPIDWFNSKRNRSAFRLALGVT